METELRQLDQFLDPANGMINANDLAKMTIRGASLSSGAPLSGDWSHAKLFAVLNGADQTRSIAMLGGQNHWSEYFANNRPFDGNIVLEGAWARAPSYALDGAIRVFRVNQGGNPEYFVYNPPAAPAVGPANPDMGVSAKGVLGNAVNIGINVANPAQNIIALVDMGAYSRAERDRTIFSGLGRVTKAQHPENANNNIFAWVQGLCNAEVRDFCGYQFRHPFTFLRSVAEHIVNPVELRVAANKIRLLMAGNSDNLSKYAGGNPANVLAAIQNNAAWTACFRTNQRGPSNLQAFAFGLGRNPGTPPLVNYRPIRWRQTNCFQSAYRLVALRSQMRTTRARDNNAALVAAGEHHKIYVFDNATFVGSFNPYPSTVQLNSPPDSALIENGLWTFDQATRNSVMANGNAAWGNAQSQWGDQGRIAGGIAAGACAAHNTCASCTPDQRCGWCLDQGNTSCYLGTQRGPTFGACSNWARQPQQCR